MLMQLFAGSAGPAQDGALQASFDAWSVQDGQISMPRDTASRLLQIRAEHAAFVFCRESVRQDDLEDVSLTDVLFCLLDHVAVLLFREQRRDL